MLVREVREIEKEKFDSVAVHPLQSWAWGDFRKQTGNRVVRLAAFQEEKLVEAYQLTMHPLPLGNLNVMIFFRGPTPTKEMLDALYKYGLEHNVVFVKLEPNIATVVGSETAQFKSAQEVFTNYGTTPGQSIFAKYSFFIDLTKSEDELTQKMHPKTRYNIKLAQKHGVTVAEASSSAVWEKYWQLTEETTKRQGFYAHNKQYHEILWQVLKPTGMVHLLTATYQSQILSTWMLFLFKNVLYYPYGAWSGEHKEVMANNLMMWEAIRWGKAHGATGFDLWGAAGPKTPKDDPWWGFTKFKEGYGGSLVEFVSTQDLVINRPMYALYNLADVWRKKFLHLKRKTGF